MTPVECAARALYRQGGLGSAPWERAAAPVRDYYLRLAEVAVTAYLRARTEDAA